MRRLIQSALVLAILVAPLSGGCGDDKERGAGAGTGGDTEGGTKNTPGTGSTSPGGRNDPNAAGGAAGSNGG